jgi:hypothetical protein
MPIPPTSGQVILDGIPLLIEPNSYSKGRDPLYGSAPLRLDQPVNLSPVSTFRQSTFQGGLGKEHFEDEEMYYLGDADTRFGWVQCRFVLPSTSSTDFLANDKGLFAIRSRDATTKPALYSASVDGQRLWIRDTVGSNAHMIWEAPKSTIRALARSGLGGGYGLNIGLANGQVHIMHTGGRVVTLDRTLVVNQAVTFFDSLAGRGDIAGVVDGTLWKKPAGGSWAKFATADMPVYDGEAWNQRLWVVGHDQINRSVLYATDTIVFQDVFRWPAAFVAEQIVLHYGRLYVLGYTFDSEFDRQIGQIWAYNGSSMVLVLEMPDDIWKVSPYATQYFKGADTYGKWLVFGIAHKGLWFYDPEQDALHPGAGFDGKTDAVGNYATNVVNFGGKLVAKVFNEKNLRGEATNNKHYAPSYLITSEYDAKLPDQLKTWVRVRVRLKEALPAGTDVQVYYTTQHVERDVTTGPPWVHAGTFNNHTKVVQAFDLTKPVTAESIRFMLKLTPSPFTGKDDNSTPRVAALEADYIVVQDTKWSWQLRAYGAPGLEAVDGSAYTYTTAQALQDALEAPVRNSDKKWVNFTDRDGKTYKVQVIDVRFNPIEDPADMAGGYIAVQLTLGEV